MTTLHGPSSQAEFMLCGLAFDAHDSGDHDQPVIEAKPGQTITCPECRAVLDYLRNAYSKRGYKFFGEPGRKITEDNSPEWTSEDFERADLYEGDKLIRPGKKP